MFFKSNGTITIYIFTESAAIPPDKLVRDRRDTISGLYAYVFSN